MINDLPSDEQYRILTKAATDPDGVAVRWQDTATVMSLYAMARRPRYWMRLIRQDVERDGRMYRNVVIGAVITDAGRRVRTQYAEVVGRRKAHEEMIARMTERHVPLARQAADPFAVFAGAGTGDDIPF